MLASVRSLSLLASLALAPVALAQTGLVVVNAQANIFGYGQSAPAPGGGAGGVVAPTIALAAGTGRTITFAATGLAGWGGALNNGPDGGNFAGVTSVAALGPISGYAAPLSGHLVGVFIEAGDISGLPAPSGMSYPTTAAFTSATYAPGLRQVFFIGDGLTGTGIGTPQVFDIPDGAGTLVLGIADAFGFNGAAGWYGDNVGASDVVFTTNPLPTPGAAALLGLGGLVSLRRKR